MRILHIPEITVPQGVDTERMESLENVAKALLARLDEIEERLSNLEKKRLAQAPMKPPVLELMPEPPLPTAAPIDSEAIKRGVLDKMWKYLNDDERPAKAV